MTGIKYDFNFLAGIYLDNELLLNNFTMNLYIDVESKNPEEQSIAFNRIDFIMQEIIENGIFVVEEDKETIELYDAIGLKVLTLDKAGSHDQIILMTITDKLNAITENALTIYKSTLSSKKGGYIEYIYWTSVQKSSDSPLISNDPAKWWNDKTLQCTGIHNADDTDIQKEITWATIKMDWPNDPKDTKDDSDNIVTLPQ